VRWSTLGIIADGVSDNTAALNALPTGVDIVADAPAGGEVGFGGQWFLRSGLRIYGAEDGPAIIRPVGDITDRRTASITQADIDRPLQDIQLTGLVINKTAFGKLFKLYVNNFSMTHCTVNHKFGFMFVRGSNQEIAHNQVVTGDGPDGFDGPGLRHLGNYPKVATTGGKPANVWIHDNHIISHDAAFQVDQSDDPWGDNQADDYLFEDNVANALAGRQILLGGGSHPTTNITVRRHRGSATGIQVRIRNGVVGKRGLTRRKARTRNVGIPGGGFESILFEDCNFDASASGDKYAVQILPENGPVRGVTFRRVTVENPYRCAFKIEAGNSEPARDITVEDCAFGKPRTERRLAAVEIDAVTGFMMTGSSLYAGEGGGVLVGARKACSDLNFDRNMIRDVADDAYGFDLRTVDGAKLTGNTVKRRPGATRSHGIRFMTESGDNPGTTNSMATGNDLSDVADSPGDPAISYAPAQGNSAAGNSGSADRTG
jgi:hypothetical protein